MKIFLTMLLCVCLTMSLVGCTETKPETPKLPATNTDVSPHMQAVALPQINETTYADDGGTLFCLSLQQIQLLLHHTAAEEKISGELQKRTEALLTHAAQIETQAQADYPGNEYWSEYFIESSYDPTRLDQSVLSLFINTSSYSGGTHPSLETDSVTYDLQSGDVIFLDDLLTPDCTTERLYQLLLNRLENQAEELYYDYADALSDRFTESLHSIQNWYLSTTGLCFHFAPYDIAPYSSGTIIAELPYSTLSGILKERYFPTESTAATGSIYAETYIEDDSERFDRITDVALCEDGSQILLYSDATVTDLRIETGSRYSDFEGSTASTTVFAASSLNVGEAIHLSADIENLDALFRLVYRSGNKEYSSFITYDELGDSIVLTNG